jgi:hypothetical protein
MRVGGPTFKDGPSTADGIVDWVNLPQGIHIVSLWDCLHDAHVVSIRSNPLDRTAVLRCEIEHLRSFHHLADGLAFMLSLHGVQSARVLRYAIWPGEFAIPDGLSREQELKLVEDYQSKWREESLSWSEFEGSVKRENEQVFDLSDATLAVSSDGSVALQLCGHLNYAKYHEVYLRAAQLEVSDSDGKRFNLEDFQKLGELYWEAFSHRPG